MRLSGGRLSVRLLQCLALGRRQEISREERSFFGTTCPRWESHDRVVAVSPERLSIASKRQTFSKLGVVIQRLFVEDGRRSSAPTPHQSTVTSARWDLRPNRGRLDPRVVRSAAAGWESLRSTDGALLTQRFGAGRLGLLRRLFVLQTPVFARDCRSLDTSRSTASALVTKPATTSFKIILTSSIKNSCL